MTKGTNLGAALANLALVWWAAAAVAAPLWLGEPSVVATYVSEAGARGAPHAGAFNHFGFLPIGALLAAAGIATAVARPAARGGALVVALAGAAYGASAFFPCDPGCPVAGSTTQSVHNAVGVVVYAAGAAGIAMMGRSLQARRGLVAAVIVAAFAYRVYAPQSPWRGAVQRAAEASLLVAFAGLAARAPTRDR